MAYEVLPLQLDPEGIKAEKILSNVIKFETMFSDYQPACAEVCGQCPLCLARKIAVVKKLVAMDSLAFEVWKDDDLCGILYLTDVVAGHDALAHLTFWDEDLRSKSTILNLALERAAFRDLKLHRVTTEIPAHMHSLARFLEKKLGFQLEGTKREAILWRGQWHDVLIYGRLA